MSNIKKFMSILLLIIIILVIILLILFAVRDESQEEEEQDWSRDYGDETFVNEEIGYVKNETMYFTVSKCIQNYIDKILLNVEEYKTLTQDEIERLIYETDEKIITTEDEKANAIMSILSEEYLKENNINKDNIYNFTGNPTEFTEVVVNEMIYKDGTDIQVYGVFATLQDEITKNAENKDVYFIVTTDLANMTFSIEPVDVSSVKNINDLNLETEITSIQTNEYNTFSYNRVAQENMASRYINNYKKIALENPEKAYQLLDEEYRNKRFGSVEEYKKYVLENRASINAISLSKYQVEIQDDYEKYICIDTNNNYYIFKVEAVMKYSVILDTYTVDLPEFLEKYNSENEQVKVGMNAEKFFQALNAKDYKYAYNVLNNTFKTNNFNTQEDFENFVKQNLFDNNKVEYLNFSSISNNTYTYKLRITDNTQADTKIINLNIVMRLNEGTDFEMSFSIE